MYKTVSSKRLVLVPLLSVLSAFSSGIVLTSTLLAGAALAQEPLPLRYKPIEIGADKSDVPANPEQPLPVTPAQVDSMVPGAVQNGRIQTGSQSTSGGTQLSGQAATTIAGPIPTNLTAKAQIWPSSPLTRYRGPRLVFVSVSLDNQGKDPIVIQGDQVKLTTASGTQIAPVNQERIVKMDNSIISPGGAAAVAGVSLLSFGLAGPIFYEMMTPQENRKRSMGTAIGRDAGRHEIEAGRLNRRVVLPNDQTSGWVAFLESDFKDAKSLSLPLLLPPFPTSGGSLTIPIVSNNNSYSQKSGVPVLQNTGAPNIQTQNIK